jgi:excisionase family DNA binding protein
MNPEHFTIQETANFLQLSERTVRRLIERGNLKPLRIGPTLVVEVSDILPERTSASRCPYGEPLMTVHDVADRLNCAPADVRRLSETGRLPDLVFGGSRRWLPEDVDALAAELANDE